MNEQVQNLVGLFTALADLLELQGANVQRAAAYRRAAESLRALTTPLEDLWQAGRLEEIPGIGKILAAKIDEYLRTGTLNTYRKLRDQVPAGLLEILEIPGIGPRTARLFWHTLGVTTVEELALAANAHQLRELKGIGEHTEQKIAEAIRAWQRRRAERIPLSVAWSLAQEILAALRQTPGVIHAEPVGSLRRMRETVGDVGVLVAAEEPSTVLARFCSLPMVEQVLLIEAAHALVVTADGIQVQARVVPPARWGVALQAFTGSQAHNTQVWAWARQRGCRHSVHFEEGDAVGPADGDEAALYAALGLPWIPPELREGRGEIEAALAGQLPPLLTRADLRGDFQCHTLYSDGDAEVVTMAQAAHDAGLRYLVVADHTADEGRREGLTPERLDSFFAEIARAERECGDGMRVLAGIEVNIAADGALVWPAEVLARFDFVIASIHADFGQPAAQITERLLAAMRVPYVDLIGHPTGRLLGRRSGANVNLDVLLQAALEFDVALEVNAWPLRLDLNDVAVRRAVQAGALLAISSGAHDPEGFAVLDYGVAVARRGWGTAQHFLNARSVEEVLAWRRQRLARRNP